MSEKLTYKTTTAIFIVTVYKHNSHLKPIKYILSFIKRNADCLKVEIQSWLLRSTLLQ